MSLSEIGDGDSKVVFFDDLGFEYPLLISPLSFEVFDVNSVRHSVSKTDTNALTSNHQANTPSK